MIQIQVWLGWELDMTGIGMQGLGRTRMRTRRLGTGDSKETRVYWKMYKTLHKEERKEKQ
jgi:hypothetical protein